MKVNLGSIIVSAAFTCAATFTYTAAAQSIEIATPGRAQTFTLQELKEKLPAEALTIDDPNYKETKTFRAFKLKDVLALVAKGQDLRAEELIFTSSDGYAPGTSAAKYGKYEAYLAFGENGREFAPLAQGKATVSPGPFYVVWKAGRAVKNEVPWPYQVVKIEWINWSEKFPLVAPKAKQGQAGFVLFKDHCIRCHSINLQGGELGPELNIPKNVTEYWKPAELKAFIKNASSYHARSKMPAFTSLSEKNLQDLIVYLAAMAKQKTQP